MRIAYKLGKATTECMILKQCDIVLQLEVVV
jgi:hypothetical protein